MYRVGVVPGKFFPPHRGHLYNFITCATMCDRMYVVISDNMPIADAKCRKDHLPYMPLELRALWLSKELQNFDHISVLILDESDIPPYPEGTVQWCARLREVVPEEFDVIFGGDVEYKDTYMQSFPGVDYVVRDRKNGRYPVSGTEIRKDPFKHWDYILGSAREFFCRRVLVTGTESCGKTTLTKYLGKIYNTSWTEEYGRYYSRDHLGGNESLFRPEDFHNIAWKQRQLDEDAIRSANRIVFFDTDAVVTQYYCNQYLRTACPLVENFVNPDRYDAVFMMAPTVKWVPDGQRFLGEEKTRQLLHDRLYQMYLNRGFRRIIRIDNEDYNARLEKAMFIADKLLENREYMSRVRYYGL